MNVKFIWVVCVWFEILWKVLTPLDDWNAILFHASSSSSYRSVTFFFFRDVIDKPLWLIGSPWLNSLLWKSRLGWRLGTTLAYSSQFIWVLLTASLGSNSRVRILVQANISFYFFSNDKDVSLTPNQIPWHYTTKPDELAHIVRLASKLEGEKYKKRNRLVTPILSFVLFLFINVVVHTSIHSPYKNEFCVGRVSCVVPFLVLLRVS